jgi:formamidopyrimidine-DNA glycosylase
VPELLEVEAYRRLAEATIGRTITAVDAPDSWFLKGGLTAAALADAVVGSAVRAARRRGKLLVVDLDGDRPALGLRFGMTGRLMVDGRHGLDHLEYASRRENEAWDRVIFHFDDGGSMRIRDPRRLGGVELDPDEERLGPDATTIGLRQLRPILAHSRAPVKAVLMDQHRVAGLGNLMTDEVLWFAGIGPQRPANQIDDDEVQRLHRAIRRTVDVLGRRGGAHTGDHFSERHVEGRCPRDGAEMAWATVGGRSTWYCPAHQI